MSLETILLVDDEEIDRSLIRRILQAENYSVLEADTYPNALKVFEQHPDAVALLIADISLPGGNGCDLAIALRNLKANLRVLFVSGHVGAEVCRFYGLDVSDQHFLRKPFTAADVRSRIRQLFTSTEPFPKLRDSRDTASQPSALIGSDQRRWPRQPANVGIRVWVFERVERSRVIDVSASGLCFIGASLLVPGAIVRIEFETCSLSAEVRHSRPRQHAATAEFITGVQIQEIVSGADEWRALGC
jgi:DNA-binding response OmpR family regulator